MREISGDIKQWAVLGTSLKTIVGLIIALVLLGAAATNLLQGIATRTYVEDRTSAVEKSIDRLRDDLSQQIQQVNENQAITGRYMERQHQQITALLSGQVRVPVAVSKSPTPSLDPLPSYDDFVDEEKERQEKGLYKRPIRQ